MPQQAGATPAQIGLAASMAAAPALQQWLAANSAPTPGPPSQHSIDIDNVNAQINMLKEQITQSENNLNAQHTVSDICVTLTAFWIDCNFFKCGSIISWKYIGKQ